MGKSPGRWMKTLLFGKKSSRSKNPKAKDEKSEDGKEVLISLDQIGSTDLSLSGPQQNIEENLQHGDSRDDIKTPPLSQHISIPATTELDAKHESDRIKEEQAATEVQAALRGYLARRAFWTLKGIIRLQALVRGHLVRRQAVSTLYCMFQIVKFQALARGRKIRHSDIGLEIQKRCTSGNHMVVHSVRLNSSTQIAKLSANGFTHKILALSPTAMPLHFQYDQNATNSVSSWLERWSRSRFWQPLPKSKVLYRTKSQKPSIRKLSATNVETIASEFDKPRRNLRKITTNQPPNHVEDDPQLVLERIKRNLRKVHNPVLESTFEPETEHEKKGTNDNIEKISTGLSKLERTPEPLIVREVETVITRENVKVVPVMSERSCEDDTIRNETKKSRRRVSLPEKQEFTENNEPPQMKRSVPSYMAATESAKAKLRGLDSPPEKTNLTRRYSLPSSTNGKTASLSPRVQRQIQTTGKVKSDRSLQLLRDGNVKLIQAEWRR